LAHKSTPFAGFFTSVPTLGYWHSTDLGLLTLGPSFVIRHSNFVIQTPGAFMADELPSLSIDTDWKKQAQEEKRRLAEQQKAAAPAPGLLAAGSGAAAAAPVAPATAPSAAIASARAARSKQRELPPATFPTIVNSMLTQVMLCLGEIATAAGPMVDLDRARQQVDLLGVLEEKTRNNLTDEERHLLDTALHESRTRFVSVASQYL
jgi:hypothetical protein